MIVRGLLSNEDSDHIIMDIDSDSFIKGVLSEDKHESDYHSDGTVEGDSNRESSENFSLSSSDSNSSSESSDLEDSDGSSHIDSTGFDVRIEEDSSSSQNKMAQSRRHSEDSEERAERAAVAIILASKCCTDKCLLHTLGHLILTARQKYVPLPEINVASGFTIRLHMVNGKIKVNYSVSGMMWMAEHYNMVGDKFQQMA